MTQPDRLPQGGRIERREVIEFSFNGKRYQGYRGDTLASALLANGVRLVGRGFKYHRPRGIISAGAEEPNAIVQVNEGARTVPNLRATQVEIYPGLSARSVNAWPSLKFDLLSINALLSRFMPAGFYYKTFMWPAKLWMTYEHIIRKAAGLGHSPTEPDPDFYDKRNAHCEVLVVGGGPTGLAAALAAARAGARVILADEQQELGGSLLSSTALIDGEPATEWLYRTRRELEDHPEVTLLTRSTVFGYYDHNFLAIAERRSDHLAPGEHRGSRERLWRVRARQVVLATGAIERPLLFPNNDRPGVMLASAVNTYLRRYGVAPGKRAVVFTNNDSAYHTALSFHEVGIPVQVVDIRANPEGELPQRAKARGIPLLTGHVVVDVQYGPSMDGVQVQARAGETGVTGPVTGIPCDVLAVSGGWSPVVHLHAQSGGRPVWDEAQACFVPGQSVQAERSAGACAGSFSLAASLAEGLRAGAMAAHLTGHCDGIGPPPPPVNEYAEQPLEPCWLVPGPDLVKGPKRFLDMQNDTHAADIHLAVREGYRNVEHVKRYTLMGFGTDQGKTGNINGMAVLAGALGQSIPATGTTTFRPAYTPVTFGTIAGRTLGELFDPIRKTAMHGWHEEHGAVFEDVGQWKRPWYYPQGKESMHEAVNRECLAVRNSVGVLDASTLGKIDVRGPDAATFLNLVYTNAWKKLGVGRCRYGLMLGEDGMVMDDGVTTRLGENHFIMTTTTGGAAHVLSWLEQWLQTEWPHLKVYLTSVTDHWATVSVAGPNSREVVSAVCEGIDFSTEAFPFMSYQVGQVAGVPARVMRISFTGELSYEINVPANYGRHVWEAVMAAGEPHGITPYGTETMHVLRAEKGFIIVGQETDGSVNPEDLGMHWILGKKEFLGKRGLLREDNRREDRKQLVGLLTDNPAEVLPEGGQIVASREYGEPPVPMLGHVTSSYWSATLGRSIALALVKSGRERHGQSVYLPLSDGRVVAAQVTEPLFYDPEGKRQHV